MSRTRRIDPTEYERLEGRPPPVDETEDAWQWDYRGTPSERAELAEKLGLQPDEPASQEDSLF